MNRVVKWIIVLILSICSLSAHPQTPKPHYGWDFVNHRFYYPEKKGLENNNLINSLFVDDNLIITYIESSNDNFDSLSNRVIRLAFHNIGGDQMSEKVLDFPHPYNRTTGWFRFGKMIGKIGNNKYITGGWNFDLTRIPGYSVSSAFWFIFDNQGDSIRFGNWEDPAMNGTRVSGIATHGANSVLAITVSGSYDSLAFPYGDFAGKKVRLIKLNEQGDILWNKEIAACTAEDLSAEPMSIRISPEGDRYYIFQARLDSFPKITVVDSNGEYLFQKEIRPTNPYLEGRPRSVLISGFQYIRGAVSPTGSLYYIRLDCEPFVLSSGDTTFFTQILHYGKLTRDGDTVWRKTYDVSSTNGYQFRYDMFQIEVAPDGDIHILTPYYPYLGYEDHKSLHLVADSNGVIKRARNYRRFQESYTNYNLAGLDFAPEGHVVMGGAIHFPLLSESSISDPLRLKLNGKDASWLLMVDSLGRRCEGDTVLWDNVPDCLVQPGVLSVEPMVPKDIFVNIYPNPTSHWLNIVYSAFQSNDKLQFNIVDMQGRILYRSDITQAHTRIDFGQYAVGMYALTIFDKEGVRHQVKIVKR